ncbi:MAG: hypothetical protein U9R25_01900 [Chloroflexota bacterium]|nr:hypothetical protein [Chloroflexota bacterium]
MEGLSHHAQDLAFFYGTPSPGNPQAQILYAQNRFSITRQNARIEHDKALQGHNFPQNLLHRDDLSAFHEPRPIRSGMSIPMLTTVAAHARIVS